MVKTYIFSFQQKNIHCSITSDISLCTNHYILLFFYFVVKLYEARLSCAYTSESVPTQRCACHGVRDLQRAGHMRRSRAHRQDRASRAGLQRSAERRPSQQTDSLQIHPVRQPAGRHRERLGTPHAHCAAGGPPRGRGQRCGAAGCGVACRGHEVRPCGRGGGAAAVPDAGRPLCRVLAVPPPAGGPRGGCAGHCGVRH